MEERMTNLASGMAIAMAVATEPFKPHSTPLQTTTSVALVGGLSVAKKSSIATAVEAHPSADKRMAADAASSRGVR